MSLQAEIDALARIKSARDGLPPGGWRESSEIWNNVRRYLVVCGNGSEVHNGYLARAKNLLDEAIAGWENEDSQEYKCLRAERDELQRELKDVRRELEEGWGLLHGLLDDDMPKDSLVKAIAYLIDHSSSGWNHLANALNKLREVRRLDTPWPTRDVMSKLVEAADILLNEGYDGHGWESIDHASRAAREWLAAEAKKGEG